MSTIIQEIEQEQMQGKDIPEFAPGDTVLVQVKIKEGDSERLQAFEGVVIAKRNRGLNSAFTVRKISHGEGVERIFMTYSKVVDSIEVGMQFMAQTPNGQQPVVVVGVEEDGVVLDGNHPLAGKPLSFEVEIVEVRAATEEEVEHGHVHGEGGHHH